MLTFSDINYEMGSKNIKAGTDLFKAKTTDQHHFKLGKLMKFK